jgi:sterol desaturase/sphingolipid hydroxylase (fatty acid hydroxylase superfamily)
MFQKQASANGRAEPKNSRQFQSVPPWLGVVALGTAFCLLLWGEIRRPLRRSAAEPKLRRNARNLAIAGVAGATLQIAEAPVTRRLTRLAETRRWGMLKRLPLPVWLEIALSIVLMDYTFYLWHALNHKIGLLWRFHQPHHIDLGLDASTALRFHFTELTVSVGWRAAQILVIGVSPLALSVWQLLMLLEILFHHSNLKLPLGVERIVSKIIVTPHLHWIHHSVVKQEQDSNLSSGLTVWDYLHGTLRTDVPQSEITIGVPAYLDPNDTDLVDVLAMPFTEQRFSWRLPNGETPTRVRAAANNDDLAP